jgi:hypothetical protein
MGKRLLEPSVAATGRGNVPGFIFVDVPRDPGQWMMSSDPPPWHTCCRVR